MAQYDAHILQQYADRLYNKAAGITVKCALIGALIGALIAAVPAIIITNVEGNARHQAIIDHFKGTGNGFNVPVRDGTGDSSGVPILIGFGAVIGAMLGVMIGRQKGFEYRLQAQLALCQMQIEFNSRQKV